MSETSQQVKSRLSEPGASGTHPPDAHPPTPEDPESRWPALVAVLAAGGLYAALPPYPSLGPRWIAPAVAVALSIPAMIAHWRGYRRSNIVLGHATSAALSVL